MEMDAGLPQTHQESIGEILKAGHHLLTLINEVLDLAKIESGNIEISLELVALPEVVDECLALTRPLADERAIRIESDDCSGIVLGADTLRLKQVLLNLLSNAIKYNLPGGQVRLHFSGDDHLTRIMVSDNGPGIPTERLGELFQPFNRLGAEAGAIQGSGIGLTISRQLVELMGGKIGVESTPGAGSTFWIELPRERKSP
jgi:signal transduction histidine kinase